MSPVDQAPSFVKTMEGVYDLMLNEEYGQLLKLLVVGAVPASHLESLLDDLCMQAKDAGEELPVCILDDPDRAKQTFAMLWACIGVVKARIGHL